MTAYQFSQPWLSMLTGDTEPTAREFANLRRYIQGLDDGTVSLFNLKLLNSTISNLTVAGNIAMGGFKLTGLGAGSTNGDSLRYEQLIGLYLLLTGGTMSGNIAMGTNKVTGLGAASANGDAVRFEQNKVIQLISSTSTTAFSTTSSTYQNTNLTASITPTSSSNKVLVIAVATLYSDNCNATTVIASLVRGSTEIGAAAGLIRQTQNVATSPQFPGTMMVLDSPATTSSTTYTARIKSSDNTTNVTYGVSSSVQAMILVEVVA